jgi:hypothetical protein
MNKSPDISLTADVKEEMILVFMNRREIVRHPSIAPNQLEYVVSKILCGLVEANEGFTQVIRSKY